MKKWNLLLAMSVVLAHPALPAVADDHPETKQLIDAVNAGSDPAKLGSYALVANILINPGKRDQQTGVFRFYRDQDRSRTELQLGAYHQTYLKNGNKLYIARSDKPVPGINVLFPAETLWRIHTAPGLKLSSIKQKKRGNIAVQCFSTKEDDWKTQYCVETQQKTLLETSNNIEKTTLAGFTGVGEGSLPTSIVIRDSAPKREIIIRDIQFSKLVPQDDNFAVPQNAREFETCHNMEYGRFLRRVAPSFPHGTRHGSATIYFHGIVQKDGSFSDVYIFSPEGPEFEKAGREAAAQWKLSPCMCGGHPVAAELETSVTISSY